MKDAGARGLGEFIPRGIGNRSMMTRESAYACPPRPPTSSSAMPRLAIERTRTYDIKQLAIDRSAVRLPLYETTERLDTFRVPPR